eukprot:evm.model.scf_12EXC.8 EVM.evm.TU.scf_12EXC.8   scf_12EXC:64158-67862(+)
MIHNQGLGSFLILLPTVHQHSLPLAPSHTRLNSPSTGFQPQVAPQHGDRHAGVPFGDMKRQKLEAHPRPGAHQPPIGIATTGYRIPQEQSQWPQGPHFRTAPLTLPFSPPALPGPPHGPPPRGFPFHGRGGQHPMPCPPYGMPPQVSYPSQMPTPVAGPQVPPAFGNPHGGDGRRLGRSGPPVGQRGMHHASHWRDSNFERRSSNLGGRWRGGQRGRRWGRGPAPFGQGRDPASESEYETTSSEGDPGDQTRSAHWMKSGKKKPKGWERINATPYVKKSMWGDPWKGLMKVVQARQDLVDDEIFTRHDKSDPAPSSSAPRPPGSPKGMWL